MFPLPEPVMFMPLQPSRPLRVGSANVPVGVTNLWGMSADLDLNVSVSHLIISNLFFHVVQLSEFLIQIVERKIFLFIQKEKLLQFSVFGLDGVKL